MKRLVRATLAFLVFASMTPPVSVGAEANSERASTYIATGTATRPSTDSTTSVIVGYADSDESLALASARSLGATVKRKAKFGDFSEVRVPKGVDVDAFVERLKKKQGVKFAEPNGLVRASSITPNDPGYANQWGARRMNAPVAWDLSLGSGVTVAVIDTGVDFNHPDLAGRLDTVNDWDFVNRDAEARDDDGHGTHVAGIIAANINNRIGVTGIAPGARVLPLKALNANGEGDFLTVAEAILYAAENARVINMSLGTDEYSSVINSAIQEAVSRDVVVVAASGNESAGVVSYPARLSNVVGVGSTNDSDVRSSFSNYGTGVDVTAPGSAIYSTIPGGYAWLSGTSMATPQVAGVVALIRAAHPALDRAGVEELLFSSAKDLGAAGRDNYYGHGRIDAAAALGGMIPRPSSGEAEDVPGSPAPASPISDSVDHASDRVDVYRIPMESGKRLAASLSGPAGSDLNLYLFGPNTSSVFGRLPSVSSVSSGSGESFDYLATTSGTYYLVVCAHRDGGAYGLTWATQWNAQDDEIPGVALATASTSGTLTGGANGWDAHDVRSISLLEGQSVFVATHSSAPDFDLHLWGPGSQSVRTTGSPDLVASSTGPGSSKSILFRAPVSGTYYVDVHGRVGSGSYLLTYGLPTQETAFSIAASATIPFGKTGSVVGTLSTQSVEMTRPAVISLYQAPAGSASWALVKTTATDEQGRFAFAVAPTTRTSYAVRFSGDVSRLSTESAIVTVVPQVFVRTPIAPSGMYRSRYYTVYGHMKPRHAKGSYPVRVYRWRWVNGAWKSYGYVKAVASNYDSYTRYSARMRLSTAGRWRLRAIAPEDAQHARSYSSGYDYVTVR